MAKFFLKFLSSPWMFSDLKEMFKKSNWFPHPTLHVAEYNSQLDGWKIIKKSRNWVRKSQHSSLKSTSTWSSLKLLMRKYLLRLYMPAFEEYQQLWYEIRNIIIAKRNFAQVGKNPSKLIRFLLSSQRLYFWYSSDYLHFEWYSNIEVYSYLGHRKKMNFTRFKYPWYYWRRKKGGQRKKNMFQFDREKVSFTTKKCNKMSGYVRKSPSLALCVHGCVCASLMLK